ncbi:MAG TPA: hypothetical protein VHP83_00015 [Aggregatilineaceae bacterium]|nr:hypothetical protein [Aggregatilineaceae bacterium]
MVFHPIRRRDCVVAALIMLIAAVMRLSDLGRDVHFAYDQGSQSVQALDMLAGKGIPTIGPESSAGVHHSPWAVYLLAPPYAISDNPIVATWFNVFLNVIGVGLLWLIGHRYFSPLVGVMAGLAYALHPYAINYSRHIWVPTVASPFLIGGILLELIGFVEGKRWAQIACPPVLIIGMQTHHAGWLMAPAILWVLWLGRRNLTRRTLAAGTLGVAVAALLLLPYAIGLATQQTSEANNRLETMRAGIKYGVHLRHKTLVVFSRVATGQNVVDWSEVANPSAVYNQIPEPTRVWQALAGLMGIGFVAIWLKRAYRPYALLLAFWILVPLAFFLPDWTGVGIFPHHFIPIIAPLCLLCGIGIAWLASWLPNRALKGVLIAACGVAMLTWGAWYQALLNYVDDHYQANGYMTPVHYLLDVRDKIEPYRDVLIVGGNSNDSGQAVWKALLYRRTECVREVVATAGGILVLPDHPFAVISPPSAPSNPEAANQYAADPVQVPLRPGEGSYTIRKFDQPLAWNGAPIIPLAQPARFKNEITLTGYALTESRIVFEWTLPGPRPDLKLQRYSARLLNAAGDTLAQQDIDFWPGFYWCAGDRVYTWIDLTIPADVTTLRVSMYHMDDKGFHTSDIIDQNGGSIGSWLDIPFQTD